MLKVILQYRSVEILLLIDDTIKENVTEENGDSIRNKAIQPRSQKRRRERQCDLIAKRASNWYTDGHSPPNFTMFYLQIGEIISEGSPHMAEFYNDPVVIQKFKEVALQKTVNFWTVTDILTKVFLE